MKEKLMRLLKDEAGQGMTEYALIIALVAIAVIVSLGLMKDEIVTVFTDITTGLSTR